jgi:hypothetical protein
MIKICQRKIRVFGLRNILKSKFRKNTACTDNLHIIMAGKIVLQHNHSDGFGIAD